MGLRRGNWAVTVESRTLSATREAFELRARLEALEGDTLVRTRSWDCRVAREGVQVGARGSSSSCSRPKNPAGADALTGGASMARTPANRSGKVLCHPSGERWTVELRLDENEGRQACQYTVYLNRVFAAETAARSAGEQVVAEWAAGRIAVRDLMLQELAATYRRLRETYQKMQPPAVPTTTSAWESAIGSWEERGWIAAADAARLREHVRRAFAPEAGGVPRRRIRLDTKSDSTP